MPKNVWERLDEQIHEQDMTKTSVKIGKYLPWILALLACGCLLGVAIGYFAQ